ncbi:MAG: hypothetical protein Q7S22_01790 [Candidatus Micrarchaeota archaeon]|nr:hypothetical protein [Candidatus Micrarchaeota archaeon]
MTNKCESCEKEGATFEKINMLRVKKYFCDQKCYDKLIEKEKKEEVCEFC